MLEEAPVVADEPALAPQTDTANPSEEIKKAVESATSGASDSAGDGVNPSDEIKAAVDSATGKVKSATAAADEDDDGDDDGKKEKKKKKTKRRAKTRKTISLPDDDLIAGAKKTGPRRAGEGGRKAARCGPPNVKLD